MEFDIAGKTAIVTGASRGLGAATTLALSTQGVRVLAVARSERDLARIVDKCPNPVTPIVCDLKDLAMVKSLPSIAIDETGRLDIVVNNAGIVPRGPFVHSTEQQMTEAFAVNVFAPMTLARAAGELFVEQRHGTVINIASIFGLRGATEAVIYSATKAAIIRMSESLSAEWAPLGIHVNTIAPGAFATDAQPFELDDTASLIRRTARIPAGRLGDPAEIGSMVVFLCSQMGDFIHGSTIVLDGGEHSRVF